ncbi:anti-phage deoxyguanosine triphosphatase [Desulfobotulus mexicanus]|uniref:Deoxyguanosinetriphosphate triphosphohydrolase-like protein n=1 Tax=Desulfobotulus mexicanus TaxID=2586642 RepID=A0A5Q4VFS5_9BACT|nr:anti-phage deoxyguanosine triphosphatase [Desulfobotulus mexicanus]TYT75122.1 deoxyguanosinetriphosphate triphosphohydrolase family protein [Desulfobotulus mexicanus]
MNHNKNLSGRRDPLVFQRKGDFRNPSELDLARIIHSAAFRRLQAKTQVLGVGEGDFHRTRLTHSMEVAQIGKGIVRTLSSTHPEYKDILPDSDQIFCIGLAHDLGHPPFGHGGEIALNYCMGNFGGFEANGQTLRILSKIETHTHGYGLNLSRRTLLGVLKYPQTYSALLKTETPAVSDTSFILASDWKPPKCYHDQESDVTDWIFNIFSESDKKSFLNYIPPKAREHGRTTEKALDTSIMEIADDIAYGIHDLEDGITLNLITKDMWQEINRFFLSEWAKENNLFGIQEKLFGNSSERKRAVGSLVHALITNTEIIEINKFENPILKFNAALNQNAKEVLESLKKFVFKNMINIPEVQTLVFRGQQIVIQLFRAISSDPTRFLKKSYQEQWEKADSDAERFRIICDYISGMTDEYATRLYERLFLPRQGTVFHRL